MTVVTGGTLINVSGHALMLLIRFSLVMLVAIYAGETAVDAADVAFRAGNVVMMRSWAYWEPLIVIKRSAQPGDGGMARFASGGEACLHVIRVGSVLIVGLVAEITDGRGSGILPTYMTEVAGRAHVRSGQGPTGLSVVVEG
jgi:hypothetical protein